jgi:phage terminase large subunit-like protein
MPTDSLVLKDGKEAPYAQWRAQGWITATPGAAINKLFVLAQLVSACAQYDVQVIAYDRWRIEDLKAMMSNEGVELPLEPFGQGFKDMAPAVDEYERLLLSGELKHDGNPVMTHHVASAVLETDPAGNRKFHKEKSRSRIDGAVAAAMAAGCAKLHTQPTTPEVFFV